jgi:hypothetical protein
MSPNSNSESSTLRGDTRCEDDTMPGARGAPAAAPAAGAVSRRGAGDWATWAALAGLLGIRTYTQNVNDSLTIYRNPF